MEGSSNRRYEGTGLGLALVKEFAELLQGSVSVQSTPGQGSTFTITCKAPAAKEAAEPGAAAAPRTRVAQYPQLTMSLTAPAGGFPALRADRRRQCGDGVLPRFGPQNRLPHGAGRQRRGSSEKNSNVAAGPGPDGRHDAGTRRLKPLPRDQVGCVHRRNSGRHAHRLNPSSGPNGRLASRSG